MEISVQIIGCGVAFASGGKFNTCFLVRNPGFNFLIDCGSTSLVALKLLGISTEEIDAIFLSHFHGDHFGGIPYILLDAAYTSRRVKGLKIICPAGGEKKIRALGDLMYPGSKIMWE